METRKVTIINGKTQSQKVIQDSRATTLGGLKAEMRQAGIDYEGMTFFEGHMRAELKDDASPLPTNIPYKGQVVNDLIFMLTAPDKKVKSGAMTRAEAYETIKKKGLQEACEAAFGKNFTQCATADLEALISKYASKAPAGVEKPVVADAPATPTRSCEGADVVAAISTLNQALFDDGTIDDETYEAVVGLLGGVNTPKKPSDKMSQREVDDMFDFINN